MYFDCGSLAQSYYSTSLYNHVKHISFNFDLYIQFELKILKFENERLRYYVEEGLCMYLQIE